MSDPQEVGEPQPLPESSRLALPPRFTPSPDATESELKLSRKREREVSQEPATPSASNDIDPTPRVRKDSHSRTPLKKNRRRLDPTQEEEDGTGSGSRSGSGSPPNMTVESPRQQMKIKVRQISRGVEGIAWKSTHDIRAHEDDDDVVVESLTPDVIVEEADSHFIEEGKTDHDEMIHDDDAHPKTPEEPRHTHSLEDLQNEDSTMVPATPEVVRLRAGSESNEKGLKRKFLERGTSHGPPEQEGINQHPNEPLKRLRDEGDSDPNPRETKKPTPPPSPPRESPPSPKIPKMSGFMAYASTSSPFATVKGQNIFGASKLATPHTKQSAFSVSPGPSPAPLAPAAELKSPFGQASSYTFTSTSTSSTPKLSGFETFAGSSSPFATAAHSNMPVIGSTSKLGSRTKSPPIRSTSSLNSNPFASYAGGNQGFAVPAPKRARAASPDGSSRSSLERPYDSSILDKKSPSGSESGDEGQDDEPTTFGERLRASRDEEEENRSDEENGKMMLTEQDVMTGEEEEDTLLQVRGKLFSLDDNTWRERGTGLLKLNVKQDDGSGARLVMRKDAVYTLLLNVTLFPGMRVSLAQDPRYIRFSTIENGITTTYNLKVSNAKIAADLLEEIHANIPS